MKNLLKKLIPNFLLSWYHWKLAFLGALIFGFPSRKLIVIGVTGTKGKTTTCDLIAQILQGAGFKTGLATTVNFRVGDKEWINEYKQTMLGRFRLQKFLRQTVREGCKYAVIETSSEGILQHRHKFIDYSCAVFTNLSPEHIERHGSFEKYREAKMKLFKVVAKKREGAGVYNLDDENVGYFLEIPMAKKFSFGLSSRGVPSLSRDGEAIPGHTVIAGDGSKNTGSPRPAPAGLAMTRFLVSNIKLSPSKTEFSINSDKFEMPLIGEFNVYNACAAICVAQSQGIKIEKIKEILKHAKPTPGRLEVINCGQPFAVIVDYAHEPASLEAIYESLKIFNPKNIIALLGAQGGGRDKAKRSLLGEIAGRYADYIIVTNEDPYDEKPEQIIDDVAGGINNAFLCHSGLEPESRTWIPHQVRDDRKERAEIFKIIDRREAIKKALSLAQAGDIVILTGKGGEVWMCVESGKKIHWDEKRIVEDELEKIKNKNRN
jgi:UDP-N-acetylmuramoyl-L-alanyl-D-glutamate--2,6-diaminopimelate ligase